MFGWITRALKSRPHCDVTDISCYLSLLVMTWSSWWIWDFHNVSCCATRKINNNNKKTWSLNFFFPPSERKAESWWIGPTQTKLHPADPVLCSRTKMGSFPFLPWSCEQDPPHLCPFDRRNSWISVTRLEPSLTRYFVKQEAENLIVTEEKAAATVSPSCSWQWRFN